MEKNILFDSISSQSHCTGRQITGNIIPHEWYWKFVDKRGSPDLPVISILSEIVYWYRPTLTKDSESGKTVYSAKFKGDAWQTSYGHFEQKLKFNHDRIRRSFIKLENLGIIKREFRTVSVMGQNYSNRLFVHISKEFLNNIFNNGALNDSPKLSTEKNKGFKNFFVPINAQCSTGFAEPYRQIAGEQYIDNKNKEKNNKNRSRSMKSNILNFLKNDFERGDGLKSDSGNTQNNAARTSIETAEDLSSKAEKLKTRESEGSYKLIDKDHFPKAKNLAEFYPLSAEDSKNLRWRSGRDFSLTAMNEILKDMSRRINNRFFYSKKEFMAYMTKVFAGEMRDSAKVSNEGFKIKANLTDTEKRAKEIEEYLTNIEYTREVSPEWHLRKKLACVLKPETAFEVLRNYRRIDVKENRAFIELNKYIELTGREKEIILSQVQATHERLNKEGIYLPITELEIKMPKHIKKEDIGKEISTEPIERKGIWGEIRRITADYFDRYKGKGAGEGIDRAWFSKLEAEVNEEQRQIKLKAPDDLCKSWIEHNYAYDLRDAAISKGFNIQGIYC